MIITEKLAKRIELHDDETDTGGISYIGETLDNFMRETEIPFGSSLKRVNKSLKDCGIKQLTESMFGVQDLLSEKGKCFDILEKALLEFVKKYGEKLTDYDFNEFGLDEGREGEETITNVYNFFDNGGCYYVETGINEEFSVDKIRENDNDKEVWEIEDEIEEQLDDKFQFSAFQCLYVVVDKEGNESLKYYRFWNSGTAFSDEHSEPDHDYVCKLSLVDLCYLVNAIRLIETTNTNGHE